MTNLVLLPGFKKYYGSPLLTELSLKSRAGHIQLTTIYPNLSIQLSLITSLFAPLKLNSSPFPGTFYSFSISALSYALLFFLRMYFPLWHATKSYSSFKALLVEAFLASQP